MNVLVSTMNGFKQEDVARAMTESRFTPSKIYIGGLKGLEKWVVNYAAEIKVPCASLIGGFNSGMHKMERNVEQVRHSDAVIVFWDGVHNPVQLHLIGAAQDKGIPVFIYSHSEEEEDDD